MVEDDVRPEGLRDVAGDKSGKERGRRHDNTSWGISGVERTGKLGVCRSLHRGSG
jgi:hypothetical protein